MHTSTETKVSGTLGVGRLGYLLAVLIQDVQEFFFRGLMLDNGSANDVFAIAFDGGTELVSACSAMRRRGAGMVGLGYPTKQMRK